MTNDLTRTLTDEQKAQIFGVLAVGCDRQTAADYIGCSLVELQRAIQHDAAFAAEVRRAEAQVELRHMGVVERNAREKENWRTSVWWLERRSPERFARRANTVTHRQIKSIIAILVDILGEEVQDTEDRNRTVARFNRVSGSLELMVGDSQPEWSDSSLSEMLRDDDHATTDDRYGD
jgi:hypothetical protein